MSKSEEFSRKFQELYPERDGKVSGTKKSDFLTGQSNRVTIIREKIAILSKKLTILREFEVRLKSRNWFDEIFSN